MAGFNVSIAEYTNDTTLAQHPSVVGIRFVYFSAENELQSKAFAEEVGLETGWNCFISLNDDADVRSWADPRPP
jgi:hypothetical protein